MSTASNKNSASHRRRSASPDFNEPFDESELKILQKRRPTMKILTLYRKFDGVAWARDFDSCRDVTLSPENFIRIQMYTNSVPGFQLYVADGGSAATKPEALSVVETQIVSNELIQGFGTLSCVSKTSCVVTAIESTHNGQAVPPRRYNAPGWCSQVSLGTGLVIGGDTNYHFMALPSVPADIALKKV